MQTYQAVSAAHMIRFARRAPGSPRCVRCGQRFHMFFRGGRLAEQRCGCGLVYRVESMGIDQFIQEGIPRRRATDRQIADLDG